MCTTVSYFPLKLDRLARTIQIVHGDRRYTVLTVVALVIGILNLKWATVNNSLFYLLFKAKNEPQQISRIICHDISFASKKKKTIFLFLKFSQDGEYQLDLKKIASHCLFELNDFVTRPEA